MIDNSIRKRRPMVSEKRDQDYFMSDKNEESKGSKRTQKPLPPNFDKKVFLLIACIRTISGIYNLIWDCDETYNYWEPLHFIMHGSGLQTWEYSPEFSLRSYAYTLLHALPLWPLNLVIPHRKMFHFYALRIVFGLASSVFETQLYSSLLHRFSTNIAAYYLIFTISNVGVFLSSTSFLPSSFAMLLITYSLAQWLSGHLNRSIFAIGCAVLLGWPFVAVFGLPIVIDYLFIKKKGILNFVKVGVIFATVISVPIVVIDSYLYGKLVFPPLNIFIYNVLSSKGGPELYGREPFSFYIKNLILNFNVLFPIGLISGLFIVLDFHKTNNNYFFRHFILIWSTMMVWLSIFLSQPHKEERFLYPIYPLLLVSAAATASIFSKHFRLKGLANIFIKLIVVAHVIISLSRLVALLFNYSASMNVYVALNQPSIKFNTIKWESTEKFNVCVGKEWYRFPSSFFLPEKLDSSIKRQEWQLRFIKADFEGQLPGYFNQNLSLPASTRFVDPLFNDQNRMVVERFIDPRKCHFLIDTDSVRDDLTTTDHIKWRCLRRFQFLDSSASANSWLKSFYIPILYERNVKFTEFKLYQRI